MDEIDFVVTYLDDSDPEWLLARAEYQADDAEDPLNTAARFRNLETLRYWLRSVERYAPWVRRVHIVTWGHLPAWLNTEHPKLSIVRHEDFIPQEYLPTFSSNAIELNIDRIPGLSERFVSFNDDMFLTAKVNPSDFFADSLPVLRAQYLPAMPYERWCAVSFWNALALNEIGTGIYPSLQKALSLRQGIGTFLSNLWLAPLLLRTRAHFGFRPDHLTQPLTRKAMGELRSQLPREFARASANRFRSLETVNIWLIADYMRVRGAYRPRRSRLGRLVSLGSVKDYSALLHSGNKVLCINDGDMSIEFEREKDAVHQAFASLLPDRSQFELK